MTIAGPPMVFGIRYWTYIWPTVMVPGCGALNADVPGWLDMVVWPLTKKLPSSCSSNGPPSDPAIAVPPNASSTDKAAAALRKFRSMPVMTTSLSRRRETDDRGRTLGSLVPHRLSSAFGLKSILRARKLTRERRDRALLAEAAH